MWLSLALCGSLVWSTDGAEWSYRGSTGPTHWHGECQTGTSQSPVNLETCSSQTISPSPWVFINYTASYTTKIVNNGHTAQLSLSLGDKDIEVSGGDLPGHFVFVQAHFHWGSHELSGSEHLVDGTAAPLEVHLVHFNNKYPDLLTALQHEDGLAVLGIMFHLSDEENSSLNPILETLPLITSYKNSTELRVPFKMESLVPKNTAAFFRYSGSLTTPGCFQVVTWTVFQDSIPISRNQLQLFRELEDSHGSRILVNYRPVQPLHSRSVYTSNQGAQCSKVLGVEVVEEGGQTLSLVSSLTSLLAMAGLSGVGFIDAGTSSVRKEGILLKYMSSLLTGTLAYWATGFGLSWGHSAGGVIGTDHFLTLDLTEAELGRFVSELQFPLLASFLVSLAVGDRASTRYLTILTFVVSGLMFPLVAHSTWNPEGWLRELGYTDTAGSGVLHIFAAIFALVALRIGKSTLPTHPSSTSSGKVMIGLGALLIIISIFLQNLSKLGQSVASANRSVLNSLLAMCAASIVLPLINLVRRPQNKSVHYMRWINCVLTAAVAMRAGSEVVASWAAILVGLIAAFSYLGMASQMYKLGVTDEVDVVSVHGAGGMLGLVAVPLFQLHPLGLVYSGSLETATVLGWNLVGGVVIMLVAGVASFLLTFSSHKLGLFMKHEAKSSCGNEDMKAETRPFR